MPRSLNIPSMLLVLATFALLSLPARAADGDGAKAAASASLSVPDTANAGAAKVGPGKPDHGPFNLHFAGGVAYGLGDDMSNAQLDNLGGQGSLAVDIVFAEPFAFSIRGGYNGFRTGDTEAMQDMFIGAGLRCRLLGDDKGPVNEPGGSLHGNLWIDMHFSYHHYLAEHHAGINAGLGWEMSLADSFNLGPFIRFQATPIGDGTNYMMLAFGLEISLGGKLAPGDRDVDGIIDEKDKCPGEAEDKDGFQDDDGCLDDDNDGDGVKDASDKCPAVAGSAALEGCVAEDPDQDGIAAAADKCPNEAEDKDSFQDDDGCPDLDNDNDGVPDGSDKCSGEAEDKDGFQDDDGCPDPDNDNDGVPDGSDKCSALPENKNGKDDEDGCPDFVKVEGDSITFVTGNVDFAKGAAVKILESSFPALEEVALILKAAPALKLKIQAYTDNTGVAAQKKKITGDRAAAVKKFLVDKGVEEGRLTAEGQGADKALGDNKTSEGRAANNRIELQVSR